MISHETKTKMKKEYLRRNPYPAPVELELPPLNLTRTLFQAIKENKTAETELGVKQIFNIQAKNGNIWDWDELERKKERLCERIKDSNKVVTGNKASISRFSERIRESIENKFILEGQIEKTKLDVKEYSHVLEEMEEFVNEYSVYEKFLQSVAQSGSEYNSVGDILNRYEALEYTRVECTRLLEQEMEEASALRKAMVRLTEEKSSELKKLENSLVELQVRQRMAKEQRRHWERCVRRLHEMVEETGSQRVTLVGGSWDMYRQMCKRTKVPITLTPNETEAQLDFIQKTIAFYKEVYTIATAVKQAREDPDPHRTTTYK